jgi:hypothetical protein
LRSPLAVLCFALLGLLLLAPARALADFELPAGSEGFSALITDEDGKAATQAGSHPDLRLSVALKKNGQFSEGDLRNLSFELPPGFFENPTALSQSYCSQADFHTPRVSPFEESAAGESCQDRSQVGLATVRTSHEAGQPRTFGLFDLQAPPGFPSEIGFNAFGESIVFIPSIRQAEGEYGITLNAKDISQLTDVTELTLTIWGNPWSVIHNEQRGDCLNELEPTFGWAKCSTGRPGRVENAPRAYLTLPTYCDAPLRFGLAATSWQEPNTVTKEVTQPPLEDCDKLEFAPNAETQLSDPRASSPSGYVFHILVDTSGVTAPHCFQGTFIASGCAPSPVRKAVVKLPEGLTINPSVGAGLGVCTPAQYAAETPTSPPGAGCPNESKIGDFRVISPIVSGAFEGSIFLAAPYDNPFGSLISVYLVAKQIERGFLVKVAGELQADPTTGALTATFDKLPQLPYSDLEIHFREGQRSPLATPPACAKLSTEADLTAWRNAAQPKHVSLPLLISSGAGGGPCPSGVPPFTPKALAGSINSFAGAYTPSYLHLTRTVTEQEMTSYSAKFPPGLLGKIAGIPYCPDAAIEAAKQRTGVAERDSPSCPAASLIGHTYSGYGVGSVLSYAPGNLYLAGPYHGSSFSVVAIDSALVGPFDLGVVIVRSAIRVDPTTTQISIDSEGSDPIPHIIKGIPIHLRDVRVYVDRPQLTLNPTNCSPFSVDATLTGAGTRYGDPSDDSTAHPTYPYNAFGCSELTFKPKVSLKLNGGTTRGKHPSLRVVVKPRLSCYRSGKASEKVCVSSNVKDASVTLPPQEFFDQGNVKDICTNVQFAAKACPKGSVYGHVRVFTPLLSDPMEGPAYLRSSQSTLPDLVFALHGQGIEVDLAGKVDAVHGGIRGTFKDLPDARFSKFVLKMFGAKRGVLVNAGNICAKTQFAKSKFLGQGNQGWISHPEVRGKCGKKRKRHRR